jgi:cytochrome c peroxidase
MRSTKLAARLALTLGLCALAGCSGKDVTAPGSGSEFEPPDTLQVEIPPGLPHFRNPDDNPLTVQGVHLGRLLFFDPILSGDSTEACGTCHSPSFAFTDHGKQFSEGIRPGTVGTRNAPPIFNLAWLRGFFWDGRAPSLEAQALQPVPNPNEMDLDWNTAVARLQRHPEYPALFGAAFGTSEITRDRVVQAIAQFERTIISADSKYDRWNRHEVELTPSERRGFELFFTERGDCFHCHGGPLLTDGLFHDNGLDAVPPDSGRGAITGLATDYGKFKTPSLRNIEYTAPYMHDGRFQTLTEVAFLKTLSDPTYLSNPDYSNPYK